MSPATQPALSIHEPLLVNTLGHCAGAIVFGIFLALVIRDRQRGSRLLMAAAVLALLWNAGSLAVLLLPSHGMLGHRNIQTTTRYVRASEDQARQAMLRLDEAV